MSKEESAGKRKLTLSVDEEVVKRAKAVGLNLSEITESVLRGFAFAPDEAARGSLYERYKELFATMQPLLRDYDASVDVAEGYFDTEDPADTSGGQVSVVLNADGTLTKWAYDPSEPDYQRVGRETEIKEIPLSWFLRPKDILSKFITSISKSKEDREERIEELEMAKRIIAAIDATAGKPSRKEVTKEKGP